MPYSRRVTVSIPAYDIPCSIFRLINTLTLDEDLEILQRGCFGYFQLGGECVNGPVGLLSGLIQRPMVLVYHFFSVAIYSIHLNFKQGSWADVPYNIWKSFTVLYTACVVILPYLLREAR